MPHKATNLQPAPIAVLLLAVVMSGCGFNPSEHVHSANPPQPVQQDDIWWIPLRVAGTADEWMWAPWEAAAASQHAEWTTGNSINVLAGGHIWQVTKTGEGQYCYDQNNTAEIEANPGLVFVAVILSLGLIGSVGFISYFATGRDNAMGTIDALEEKIQTIETEDEERCREFARERAAFKKQQKDTECAVAAERQALATERVELEQEKTTLAAARRDTPLQPNVPTRDEWHMAAESVRARAFSGQGIGRGLIVRHFLDPRRSGIVVFQWEITLNRPYPPTFIAYRNSKQFHEESGSARGEFSDQLLHQRKRHRYKFTLTERGRELPEPVLIELTIPPFAAWEPDPAKPESAAERRRRKEAWRQEQYRQAETYARDPQAIKTRKAEIDIEVCEKFGEE